MIKNKFIDMFLDDCEDEIDSTNVPAILDYLEKHKQDIDTGEFQDITTRLFKELLKPQDVERYKKDLGEYLYIYFAYALGLQDIKLSEKDFANNNYKLNSNNWQDNGFNFNSITLFDDNSVTALNYVIDGVSCKELIIEGKSRGDFNLSSCRSTLVTFKSYVENFKIGSCKSVIFEDDAVEIKDGVISLPKTFSVSKPKDLTQIVLPDVEGVTIPRWMCKINENLTIYKNQGQKVTIYKNYRDWLKEHVKSI